MVSALAQEVIVCSLGANRTAEMTTFAFRYVCMLFGSAEEKGKLVGCSRIVQAGLENIAKLDPVKKVPVYDQYLQKPSADTSLTRVTEDVFVPLFLACSQALQSFYLCKHPIPPAALAPLLYNYTLSFSKFYRDKALVSESIRTLWLIFSRAKLDPSCIRELCLEGELRVVVLEEVIDFLMARLETLTSGDRAQINMVFDIFLRVVECCPKIEHAGVKLLDFYPNYPTLLETLFKYSLDEKDIESRTRYMELLEGLCAKLRPWFELELRLSEEKNRFARMHLLRSVLEKVR